ncbi:MAG: DUF6516 family protein [bacterium]
MREILERVLQVTEKEFPEILKTKPSIIGMKLRIYLIDGSLLDVYYHPKGKKYSFHWQKQTESVRINTAPHHRHIVSYPRHIHTGQRIEADKITDTSLPSEEPQESTFLYKNTFR